MHAFQSVIQADIRELSGQNAWVTLRKDEAEKIASTPRKILTAAAYPVLLVAALTLPFAAAHVLGGTPVSDAKEMLLISSATAAVFFKITLDDMNRASKHLLARGMRPIEKVNGLLKAIPFAERPKRVAQTKAAPAPQE